MEDNQNIKFYDEIYDVDKAMRDDRHYNIKPLECKLSREELEKLGMQAVLEYEVTHIEKEEIEDNWYGLYTFFTVETQHCHCLKEDFYYILGMVKYVKDNQGETLNSFYSVANEEAMKFARKQEVKHMKKVYKDLLGYPCKINDMDKIVDELNDNDYFVCNYFAYYRDAEYYKKYYELMLGIKGRNND